MSAPADPLELMDWKRRVFGLYAEIRASEEPEAAWRLWRETVVFDPSAAELYQIDFWLHAGAAVSIVGVTLVAWRVLRPRGGA